MTAHDPPGPTDVPLVARVETFEAFYRREYRQVLGLAAVLCGDLTTAEDLTQDAFASTMQAWHRVASMDNPGAWVRRIVANRSISRFRRGLVELKALTRMGAPATVGLSLSSEIALDVWREVRRLPKRQAQVVALTYLSDLSRLEVAETLGCSEETVKTHLDRARQRLAVTLSEYGGSA
ncbi:MAG: SigE family RNA polymerase sigma factor [Actinobacteria bacterium]|nr:SigE family RNA polymerase sigma factor [Actinomycetota bacterium]MCI0545382.1 SigE family RNA polymerase sigma factor [Actinomycetota bacterium]MCI0678244.1 SigE family RNA polymerase sigma factor [Actinomycetota bacterium]